jgi:hypothetical protein
MIEKEKPRYCAKEKVSLMSGCWKVSQNEKE